MRKTCLECTTKHVGSAMVLMSEVMHGYQSHVINAVGELEQGVQESETEFPKLSEKIRAIRKRLLPDTLDYIVETDLLEKLGKAGIIAEYLDEFREEVFGELLAAWVEGRYKTAEEAGTAK